MPDISDYTVVLSGPVAQRGPLLASLERAGTDLSEPQEHDSHWSRVYGNDDPTVGWVTCRAADVDGVVEHATRAGWQLRAHWNTSRCPACGGSGQANSALAGVARCLHCGGSGYTNRPLPAKEDLLQQEIEVLKGRLARLESR